MKKTRIYFSLLSLIMILGLSAGLPFEATSDQKVVAGKNAIVARVDNQPITIQEIEDKKINELRVELHKRLKRNLQLNALQKLSKKFPEFGQTYQPEISDKVATDFYLKNKLQNRGTLKELKPRIKSLLQMQALANYYDQLYQKALKRGLIVSYLQAPNEFLVRVPIESAYLWENKGESVMVLEFSDYQCPFCNRVQGTLSELRNIYRGRVAFGYRHTPLAFHKEADEAAIAAECARDQGNFEKYHKTLFINYQNLTIDDLIKYASKSGMPDLNGFKSCLAEERYRSRVENDQKAASKAGIQGTPGFVIGKYDRKSGSVKGEIVSGAQPQSVFVAAIEKYLRDR
ncbi:MAG: thioredoxin domain-containing protein [Deltaproteobacteria bacterium]|nr:thioredoxin domain-containing protein [Deltaproteobacteria bacterium]MBT4642363.1 thioredoxin domain-containing protein [Deltaproteobacteria bacterium]MBT6500674.1 thioredoxin domain-containing protein [Deltaproteobacteria bacterium]MBT6614831.1 thioredoxin domain-containing protein [Deltaproteobacteria bacterium]MBT7154065.1 thioredoxin domain-containing protein [Deltaproteobacteria bacterium]